MKWELDDNTRSALHYLMLGALVIGAIRLGWWGVYAIAYRGLPSEELMFRHGYLGLSSITLVVAEHTASERILGALAIALVSAFAVGIVVALVLRGDKGRLFRKVAVITLIPGLIWALWAALFSPRKYADILPDAIVIHYQKELFLDLPLPFTAMEQMLDRNGILLLGSSQSDPSLSHRRIHADVSITGSAGQEVIGCAWFPDADHRMDKARFFPQCDSLLQRIGPVIGIPADIGPRE